MEMRNIPSDAILFRSFFYVEGDVALSKT